MTPSIGDPARHFFLNRAVARSLGISLSDALSDGRLSARAYAGMVTNCRACLFAEACEHWLAAQISLADAPPPQCRNGALWRDLKPD